MSNVLSPKAKIRSWPVCEVNGLIMVYNHALALAPTWEMPEISRWTKEEWTPFRRQRWKVRTHVQEIVENGMDNAHFTSVHR